MIPSNIQVTTGGKEQVGHGYWTGILAVSATALKKTSLSGAVPRERSLGGRGCLDAAWNQGNTQTLWNEAAALISSLSQVRALH